MNVQNGKSYVMKTFSFPESAEQSTQTVTIHYKDGRLQDAVLISPLFTSKTIRYLPRSPVDDRRRFLRVPFIKEVRIDQLGIRRATDISCRGMYVECLTPYPDGTVLPVTMELGKDSLCLQARVAFTDPGMGMGLEFFRLSAEVRFRLEGLIHRILKNTNGQGPPSRRRGKDRRAQKFSGPLSSGRLKKSRGTRDRRRNKPEAEEPVEVELSKIKLIFFQTGLDIGEGMGNEVVIEFRDGEEIQATCYDIEPEPLGFFVNLKLAEDLFYTLFIVKSAVKNIQYIF